MLVAGVDEAGRGPLAGPVVAAAVVFPEGYCNPDIKDSKKLSSKKREQLAEIIKRDALSWSIVAVGHRRIDKLNILRASLLAMSLAVKRVHADFVLVDGNQAINIEIPQETIVKGDAKVVQISAASILAKVWRDHLMVVLDKKYPGYNFSKHAGYPTALHRTAIISQGPSPVHRKTFRGIKEFS
ncbi:MAG: ribonuclease HII [SAR324 cluster bacterium]|uniref:Ribonuclease HII n=1 Tax=SAR324 cluster bacterium TaxID=2024889 RepID=A0A7X9FQ50_9DELT|nr:ribonuclease HII [SAR324 cluster bacterium]